MLTIDTHVQARTPRPYQREGIAWLQEGKRKFLTDGFGLGKTAQAIWAAETPALVVAPVHLLRHWKREILACYPDALVRVADADDFQTRKVQLLAGAGVFPGGLDIADFYVCNIEMLRTNMHIWFDPLRPQAVREGWGIKTFIVDEAHRLRGHNSQQSRGAVFVAQRVPRVYFLTATPVFNQPNDLYSLLNMLDPGRFGSYWGFVERYLAKMMTPHGPKILGLKKGKELLSVFKEYAMGRSREDVKAQLPALQESLLEIKPPREWYDAYEKLKRSYRTRDGERLGSQQTILQALRGFTQQAKLQAVCTLIQDNNCADYTLVYTYHKDLAHAIGHLLKAPVITGDMAPRLREQVAQGNNFVVATFPSIAEGINLSHMQNVIFVEHDWQVGMVDQALNRVYRPGNPHANTFVYHVAVSRSVDTVIYNIMKKRGATLDEVVAAALEPVEGYDDEAAPSEPGEPSEQGETHEA